MSATAQQTLSPPLIAENHPGTKERCEDDVIADLVSGISKQRYRQHDDLCVQDSNQVVQAWMADEKFKDFVTPSLKKPLSSGNFLHPCSICPPGKVFRTSADLDRHRKTFHGILKKGDRVFRCKVQGCKVPLKIWSMFDNFKQHVIRMHGEEFAAYIETMEEAYDIEVHGPVEPAKNRNSRTTPLQVDLQFTRTTTHGPANQGRDLLLDSVEKDVAVLHSTPACAPSNAGHTDSGYASLNPIPKPQDSHVHELSDNTGGSGMDDSRTIYSGASVESTRRGDFVHRFANRLVQDSVLKGLNLCINPTLCNALPDMLADFAVRLLQNCNAQGIINAGWFIHKYRSAISKSIEHEIQNQNDQKSEDDLSVRDSGNGMLLEELMQVWFERNEKDPPDEPQSSNVTDEILIDDDTDVNHDYEAYAHQAATHPSYRWLLGKIRGDVLLTNDGQQVEKSISSLVLHHLPKAKMLHRSTALRLSETIIEVDWSPLSYMQQQVLGSSALFCSVGSFITLTGTVRELQALTCVQYVEQVWPEGGGFLVNVIDHALQSASAPPLPLHTRPDGATIAIQQIYPTLKVMIKGARGAVAEIAEQLAWLGAAFRVPPSTGDTWYCVPSIQYLGLSSTSDSLYGNRSQSVISPVSTPGTLHDRSKVELLEARHHYDQASDEQKSCFLFSITFDFERIVSVPVNNGLCWRPLLRGLAIVKDYPILKRPEMQSGLEVPLKIMANFVGTDYVQEFAGNIYIKGFSAMLVPTRLLGTDALVWHLCCDESGDHMSYLDHGQQNILQISKDNLNKYRHIVGWCSDAGIYTGAPRNQYDMQSARLPGVRNDGMLTDSSIISGNYIHDPLTFSIPKQHESIHLRQKGLSKTLKWLSSRHEERESVGSAFLFNWTHLKEAESPYVSDAAKEFFGNESNLKQKISKSFFSTRKCSHTEQQDEYELVEDRVVELYYALEKALTYQQQAARISRQARQSRSLKYLEGWDFVELANQASIIDPCVEILPPAGQSWVGLLRSLDVVTLFAEGFGELIKPSSSPCCEGWRSLPSNSYLVAVSVADVCRIIETKGNPNLCPPLLSRNPATVWFSANPSADHCGCRDHEKRTCGAAYIQTAWPQRHRGVLPQSQHAFDLPRNAQGAVVFGHNATLQYYLSDAGPVLGTPSCIVPAKDLDPSFHDSGIGSSLEERDTANESSEWSLSKNSSRTISHHAGNFYPSSSIRGSACVQMGNNYYYGYDPAYCVVPGRTMFTPQDVPKLAPSLPSVPAVNKRHLPDEIMNDQCALEGSDVFSQEAEDERAAQKRQRLT
ncbi:hypothetical protein LTR64_007113 [Lithohypha guttulata]|uniref:uncharacterized protein n=1 Tax=Lithohypha guttulata TaxID=1690604 RepID=UPI002DDFA924|nr:hypothetical protein LTR51_004331 [Lithohypha guttulata]